MTLRYSICPVPHVDLPGGTQRYTSQQEAEKRAREVVTRTGEQTNLIRWDGGTATVLAVVRRDALDRVWVDLDASSQILL